MLVFASLGITHAVGATPVDDKRAEAKHINDQIDSLNNQAFNLGAQYDRVQAELQKVNADVAAAQKRVSKLDAQVSSMRTAVRGFAVQSYVGGVDSGGGIAALLGAGDSPSVAAQRDQYTELVLGSSMSRIDQLESVSQDATRARKELERKQASKRKLQASLKSKQKAVTQAIQKADSIQSQVKGELSTLVAQDQARRARETLARDLAKQRDNESTTTAGRRANSGTQSSTTSGGSRRSTSSRSSGTHLVSSGGGTSSHSGGHVPAPSPGAAGAVAAALSQLGVPYRFATAIPGVAFDCSGLTAWAWGRAGVALPHQSRAQYAALPHVSQSQVQPGDLLFYYNPIGHVAMYIGNGQLVQATHPGDVVSVNAVSWSRVVGIARP
jgi:cell wall-associated NlpC family hydrolase